MSADMFLRALLCPLLLCLPAAAQDVLQIRADPEGVAVLPCQAGADASVTLLEWRRRDLPGPEYVFFFREERAYPSYQLPALRGRVELRDPEMKNGDVSVVLSDVNVNDTGEYECRVIVGSPEHNQTARAETRTLVHLTVPHAGNTTGNERLGLVAALLVSAVLLLLLCVLICVIFKRKVLHQKDSYKRPPEPSAGPENEKV